MGTPRILLAALFAVFVGAVSGGAPAHGADAPKMDKDELKALIGNPDVAVLDVRAGRDWDSSGEKIAGAVREDPGAVESWAGKYPKDKTLVLYCA